MLNIYTLSISESCCSYLSLASIIIIPISYLSILPYPISIDSDSIKLRSTSNMIAALNLFNLVDILIKVFNIALLATSNDLSIDFSLLIGM